MNFTFETQGVNTYLVYQLTESDELDTLSLGMITNNRINNLAPILFTQMDDKKYLKYNISSKTTVKEFFSGIVTKNRLLGVFSSISSAMLAADEYMLNPSSFLLDLEHLYVDVRTNSAMLICVPLLNVREQNIDLAAFFKGIIFSLQFDSAENQEYVTHLISYLNSNPIFSLEAFKKIIDDLQYGASSQQPPHQPTAQPHVTRHTAQPPIQQTIAQPPAPPPFQQPPAAARPAVQPSVHQPQMQQPVMPPAYNHPPAANPPAPPTPQQSFAVPGAPPVQPQQPVSHIADGEKEMTMFKLMMSYSKENKALYDKQKERKKQIAAQAGPPPAPNAPKPSKKAAEPPQSNFAIPGQAPIPVTSQQQPFPPPPPPPPLPQTHAVPNAYTQAPPQKLTQPQPARHQQTIQPQPVAQQQQPTYQQPAQSAPGANFGETSVLSGPAIGETSVLTSQLGATAQPYMIRKKNNEKVIIDKPVYRIGKEKSYVDYFIGDNTAISRSHANIINRDGEYFMVDTNSTNHVYINGAMIPKNTETKISHGDTLKLANEEFEFKQI
jgi:pSer/pThr/pTyr-binding forkhead associated (FHA) protein